MAADHIEPSLSQSLLLQALEQLSGVDQRIGILQGQCIEILREQQRAADGREKIYAKINHIDVLAVEIARLAPMVDRHERKYNETRGAMSFGRTLLSLLSGAAGAGLALLAKWLTQGQPPHH
jgi:hypothetical protein